jgi:hypothetical protein
VGRWARENEFNSLVRNAVDSVANIWGAWPGLDRDRAYAALKAIVARESRFDPAALRGEPQLGDASIGLTQVLYSTARGLGFPGPVGDRVTLTGLYAPATNLFIGAKHLWKQLARTGGDLDAAFSAYNGGYRPDLGFGAKRTADTPRVCIVWKVDAPKTGRILARDCAVVGSTTPGTFSNQTYVSTTRDYYNYFFGMSPGNKSPARGAGNPDQVG